MLDEFCGLEFVVIATITVFDDALNGSRIVFWEVDNLFLGLLNIISVKTPGTRRVNKPCTRW